MKNTIIYNGKAYNLDTVKSYYDPETCESIPGKEWLTEQEFFEEYIKKDPDFTAIFEYDITAE